MKKSHLKNMNKIKEIQELLNLPPNRVKVNSSVISEIAFHFKDQDEFGELEVVFNDGHVYFYLDVSVEVYKHFVNTESKGKFLNAEIVPHYQYRKV